MKKCKPNFFGGLHSRAQHTEATLHLKIYGPGQNIWNKMEQPVKTGQEKKSLVSVFACFLTAIGKV